MHAATLVNTVARHKYFFGLSKVTTVQLVDGPCYLALVVIAVQGLCAGASHWHTPHWLMYVRPVRPLVVVPAGQGKQERWCWRPAV